MRDRLIELLNDLNVWDDYISNEDIADHLIANGVIVPPYKSAGDEIYIHQFDNNEKKVVVECGIIECDTANEWYIVKLKDGRILNLLFAFVGKTVFLTKEEAERALKECEKV